MHYFNNQPIFKTIRTLWIKPWLHSMTNDEGWHAYSHSPLTSKERSYIVIDNDSMVEFWNRNPFERTLVGYFGQIYSYSITIFMWGSLLEFVSTCMSSAMGLETVTLPVFRGHESAQCFPVFWYKYPKGRWSSQRQIPFLGYCLATWIKGRPCQCDPQSSCWLVRWLSTLRSGWGQRYI